MLPGRAALSPLPAALLALHLAGCAAPPPPAPPPASPPSPPVAPPSPFAPLLGFADPGRAPRRAAPAPRALLAEGPPTTKRFQGTIELTTPARVTLVPGEARRVPFGLGVQAPDDVPAALRAIRVTGFDGLDVGLAPSFVAWSNRKGLETLGGLVLEGALWFLAPSLGRGEQKPAAPLSLDVPRGHVGLGELHVSIPAAAAPGRWTGTIEIEGNFGPRSFPFEVTVVRFEEKVAARLAGLAAPEADTALGALLARAPAPKEKGARKRVFMHTETQADGDPQEHGAFRRWLPAGSGVYDLGALEWLGPIADRAENEHHEDRAIAGPPDDPRLYILNERSVDVIRIRERRTVDRLLPPDRGWLSGPIQVNEAGDRVLASCGRALCSFRQEGGRWSGREIPEPCAAPRRCVWSEVNPELSEVVFAVSAEDDVDRWNLLVRVALDTGARTEIPVAPRCAAGFPHRYDPKRRRVVGVIPEENGARGPDARAVGLSIVDLVGRRVEKHPVTPAQVQGLWMDAGTGEVLFETATDRFDRKTEACLAVMPGAAEGAKKTRGCDRASGEASKAVAGTTVLYAVQGSVVSFAR